MSVFMSRTEKSVMGKKLVGVHIPKEDAHRIALLSLQRGIPRSAILLEIINPFLATQDSLSKLVERAVNDAHRAWKLKNEVKNPPKLASFIFEIKIDLRTHRIDKEIIEQIIDGVKEKINDTK